MTKQPEIEHPTPADANPPEKTWRILFLDSIENIGQLKEAGKKAGYVVIGLTTIQEAMAFLLGKDHVDVIVCAAHLEEESMFQFLKSVRDDETHQNSAFLILSLEPGSVGAQVDLSTARAGMALGADGYLIMPEFNPKELIAQIAKLKPAVPLLQQSTTAEEKRRAE
jgi:DNA-binding response OmpR family regulator